MKAPDPGMQTSVMCTQGIEKSGEQAPPCLGFRKLHFAQIKGREKSTTKKRLVR